ncbi:FadR/GntR family transcriptional regulator [Fictibacillus enclensis]|uniref:FadR/GntR family transcriptional regulator n=1 Tax=Fictibacillus enclensis TaxID=1017270 RepID=UPI0024BF6738|nr:GntR family transcriptional regulator [Fictibacillus enclensis]WHY70822.1 GntR family transcriptional regulator [Fictibacillus enclensis]
MSGTSEKVYVEIIKKIKSIIEEDDLQAGDKLPSERELTDRLHVGRSSVREALRSLELLGLIETRRGEGTFIKPATGHRLVEVLASFILHDQKARQDLLETKSIIIRDCIELAVQRVRPEDIEYLNGLIREIERTEHERDLRQLILLFQESVIKLCNNHLLYRLWVELSDYGLSVHQHSFLLHSGDCSQLLEHLKNGDSKNVIQLMSQTM